MKKGRFTLEEASFLNLNSSTLSVDEIASSLNRDPKSVRLYIKEKLKLTPIESSVDDTPKTVASPTVPAVRRAEPNERAAVSNDLRKTQAWRRLQDEFEDEELLYLEERYVATVSQFGEVVATEETQILQVCKLEVLMSRNLQQRKKALFSIRFIESAQRDLLEEYCPSGDRGKLSETQLQRIMDMETQLNAARSEEQSKTAEYDKLGNQHSKLMTSLKATRDQRLERAESSKANFLDMIRNLQEKDVQAREGRQMELVKLAGQRELIRLGRPIKYDDGNMDSPILCPETVNLGPEEE